MKCATGWYREACALRLSNISLPLESTANENDLGNHVAFSPIAM